MVFSAMHSLERPRMYSEISWKSFVVNVVWATTRTFSSTSSGRPRASSRLATMALPLSAKLWWATLSAWPWVPRMTVK